MFNSDDREPENVALRLSFSDDSQTLTATFSERNILTYNLEQTTRATLEGASSLQAAPVDARRTDARPRLSNQRPCHLQICRRIDADPDMILRRHNPNLRGMLQCA